MAPLSGWRAFGVTQNTQTYIICI